MSLQVSKTLHDNSSVRYELDLHCCAQPVGQISSLPRLLVVARFDSVGDADIYEYLVGEK
jgi:hypothetical protein